MKIPAPPAEMDGHERVLNSGEIAKSPCTNLARRVAAGRPGTVMSSEKGSYSDEFGNIYRYDLVVPIEHEGKIHRVRSIFVVWSKDCETIGIATYPTFRLPGSMPQR